MGGEQMPDKEEIHIPGFTKTGLFELAVEQIGQNNLSSKNTFLRMWKKDCAHLKVPKTQRFTKCTVCTTLKGKIQKAKSTVERSAGAVLRKLHFDFIRQDSLKYSLIESCEENCINKMIGSRERRTILSVCLP
jgi:hypothetical protein